jgi:hypothetical protein
MGFSRYYPHLMSTLAILVAAAIPSLFARADYEGYGGGYGGSYGGSYGGYSYNRGYGGYGGGSMPIISLELNEQESLNSSLRVAARENRLKDLERLIERGGDVNGQSKTDGESALIYAAGNCSPKVVSYLLSLKSRDGSHRLVRVNLRDKKGRNALMYAAGNSCVPVVKQLLEVPEIELSGPDHAGMKVADYALQGVSLEMGGPASETYVMIRDAIRRSRIRAQRAGQLSTRNR